MDAFGRYVRPMLVVVGAVMLIGCGRNTDPVIVGGNDPKYQRPADAEAAYLEAMQNSRQQANQ